MLPCSPQYDWSLFDELRKCTAAPATAVIFHLGPASLASLVAVAVFTVPATAPVVNTIVATPFPSSYSFEIWASLLSQSCSRLQFCGLLSVVPWMMDLISGLVLLHKRHPLDERLATKL